MRCKHQTDPTRVRPEVRGERPTLPWINVVPGGSLATSSLASSSMETSSLSGCRLECGSRHCPHSGAEFKNAGVSPNRSLGTSLEPNGDRWGQRRHSCSVTEERPKPASMICRDTIEPRMVHQPVRLPCHACLWIVLVSCILAAYVWWGWSQGRISNGLILPGPGIAGMRVLTGLPLLLAFLAFGLAEFAIWLV